MPFTKEEDAKLERKHFEKYDKLAQAIGITELQALIVRNIALPTRIMEAVKIDRHLNNIPLYKWDAQHSVVWAAARKAGVGRTWALCETVCVLKHVARHYIANVPEPAVGPETWTVKASDLNPRSLRAVDNRPKKPETDQS